jgi:hypothetical protein
MKKRYALLLLPVLLAFTAGFDEVCGNYYGDKDDYTREIKLYDDSVFSYSARREFPFEVSEGTWLLKGDTVILNSTPCKDPEALNHPPFRTYRTITEEKYLFRKNTLIPLSGSKQVKSEILQKEK